MPSYRFCRPDDIPLLASAIDSCYSVHFPGSAPMTLERFKREIRELDLWASNCVVALAGNRPIGVSIATKREHEVAILRLGVRSEHQRQGHARSMVNQLIQKLAILGPPRLVTEIPEECSAAARLFASFGFRAEMTCTDLIWSGGSAPAFPEMVFPITWAEVVEQGFGEGDTPACWERCAETLEKRQERTAVLAIASMERIEACLAYVDDETSSTRRLLRLVCHDPGQSDLYLPPLIQAACSSAAGRVILPRSAPNEPGVAQLERKGFAPGSRTTRYVLKIEEE